MMSLYSTYSCVSAVLRTVHEVSPQYHEKVHCANTPQIAHSIDALAHRIAIGLVRCLVYALTHMRYGPGFNLSWAAADARTINTSIACCRIWVSKSVRMDPECLNMVTLSTLRDPICIVVHRLVL